MNFRMGPKQQFMEDFSVEGVHKKFDVLLSRSGANFDIGQSPEIWDKFFNT